MFLAKAGGMEIATPEPITREELFLKKIADFNSSNDAGGDTGGASGEELYFGSAKVVDNALTWDGNTEGLITGNLGTITYYRVSSLCPILDGSTAYTVTAFTGEKITDTSVEYLEGVGSAVVDSLVFIIYADEAEAFPKPGIYFFCVNSTFITSLSIDGYTFPTGGETVNKLSSLADGSLTEITAEDLKGATKIADYAFYYCTSLTSVVIPDGITSIGGSAFYFCSNLTSITIPDSVTSIGSHALQGCSRLTSVVIPDSVTSIGAHAFYGCKALTSITIPNGVTKIAANMLDSCTSLKSITIHDGVTSIGNNAFRKCESLTNITIPNGVTSIGTYVFLDCTSMEYYDFTSHTAVPTLSNTNAFASIPDTCEIRVPSALYDEWISATNWSTYADHIVAV